MATLEAKPAVLPPPPLFLLLSMTFYGTDHPFDQFGSAALAASPPKLLPIPSLLTERARREAEKVLTLWVLC